MPDYGKIQELIDLRANQLFSRVETLQQDIKLFHEEMTKELEALKTNEILVAIGALNNRLNAIESRLPPVEEEE